jgi:hypothetical protein
LNTFFYLINIEAPASSKSFLASSAASLETASHITFGTDSIRSFASFKPKDVKLRTVLITLILFVLGTSCIITSNSVFSSISGTSTFTDVEELTAVLLIGETLASTPKVVSKKLKFLFYKKEIKLIRYKKIY